MVLDGTLLMLNNFLIAIKSDGIDVITGRKNYRVATFRGERTSR